jgi:ankyrin repeat protein
LKKKIFAAVNEGSIEKLSTIIKANRNTLNFNMRDKMGNSPVGIATCRGDLPLLKLLIRSHFNINAPNHDGNTPLHFGISLKQLKCVE